MNQKEYDYLIVGGGIAGLMLSHQMSKAGKTFLVMDDVKDITSSKIAAGMFNPISGKRMSVNWKAEELLASLISNFKEMSVLLNLEFIYTANILQAFGNVKESNDFGAKLDRPEFSKYIALEAQDDQSLLSEFGRFEVLGSGWVKTKEWIETYQNYLVQQEKLVYAKIIYAMLQYQNNAWNYENKQFKKIIFCEGYLNQKNPYFNWLPFKLCKGEVLLIKCEGLNQNYIYKRGVYLVHQEKDIYKVGATYEWDYEHENATNKGKESLIEKVKQMIALPFEVIDQMAGIRPTTRDRAAILGAHPSKKGLYIFNGLGTKGILQAPYLSEQLFGFLEQEEALPKEVDINRFKEYFALG
ncbi:MAG: FAD-dependent oxidoreductase [bacterium]|nr:FAD-dependent oxidoreductase [bacterium]